MNHMRTLITTAVVGASIAAGHPAQAQTTLLAPAPETGVWLEAARPHFKDLDVTIPTSIWYLGGRMAVNERLNLVADVPFSYAGFDDDPDFGNRTNSVLGNPYIGVEYLAVPRLTAEFGVRAPITTADGTSFADVIGFLGEPQRGEAFLEDAVPVSGALTFEQPFDNGAAIRARAGVTAAFYTGDDDDEETSTFADYGLFGNYSLGLARVGAGISGRWNISADDGSFSDNSLHQLAFTVDAPIGRVRPGLSLRLPLDSTHRDIVDYSIGAYLQVPLR
jgi:hypothetical protein